MNFVVVHRGARDGYQCSLAMAEAGKLERLVTDLYVPHHSLVARLMRRALGANSARLLGAHGHAPIATGQVKSPVLSSVVSLALEKTPKTPVSWRAKTTRWNDRVLGRMAGHLARSTHSALLSYSYYAYSAFTSAGAFTPRLLFQLHPHPASMRAILRAELAKHPDCASSLEKEWELLLPESEFMQLCRETEMADSIITASTFTKQTLIENGIGAKQVQVCPYGVDLQRFYPGEIKPGQNSILKILFAGTVNQRKGIKYLLEAVRALNTSQIQLFVRGRAVDDLSLVRRMLPEADVRLSVTYEELLCAYQSCHLFVFPSVGEGFGHVLLEAMASGLPVLSTTHTAAPDLVTPGEDGFVIEPRSSEKLAERLDWALAHRRQLAAMRERAREKAALFTWREFRVRLRAIVEQQTGGGDPRAGKAARHV